jgi:hypothetical protein
MKFLEHSQMRLKISLQQALAAGGVNDGTPSC